MKSFKLAVLCGGISPERDVSLVSGSYVAKALENFYDVEKFELAENKLPEKLNGKDYVVMPVMHGDYGENGGLQRDLENANIAFAGCGSLSSSVCMVKPAAKALMRSANINTAKEILFCSSDKISEQSLVEILGNKTVIKPADKGSSVGLKCPEGVAETDAALKDLDNGQWMAESFFKGRELSVGVLNGRAMGIVEIKPEGGVYDFKRKYTAGSTKYEFPAQIGSENTKKIQDAAARAYIACGCRDFCRVDFILGETSFIALEINTLPGMTPTSLLPKSASCIGLSFNDLCNEMVKPAIQRFLNS